jgi:NADH-quinone oxidoreductase subunit L
MLVNRVGDVGLMLGICTAFLAFKSVDYAVIFGMEPVMIDKTLSFFGFELSVLSVISFLFF